MRKIFLLLVFWCFCVFINTAQTVSQKLQTAVKTLGVDSQLKHGIMSLYVVDVKTGKVVIDKNAQIGLAPASTQKIFTSIAAFELLGANYRYKTELGYDGTIEEGVLKGTLYLLGSGDPTLGSWRYADTKDSIVLNKWLQVVKRSGIKKIDGTIFHDYSRFSQQSIPDGWIWQDIGNYYGAGAEVLNWKENQYDVVLQSPTTIGSLVKIISPESDFINELIAAKKGTGDNAFIYLPQGSKNAMIKGTIPAGEPSFKISGAVVEPIDDVLTELSWFLMANSIPINPRERHYTNGITIKDKFGEKPVIIQTHFSPPLDSINYWFLKKSINLYGEALIKAIAYEKSGFGSTEKGVELVKDFWSKNGIEKPAINIFDGSGLSPQNRVTAHALVKALQYAKNRPWFSSFYNALPEINGMKMKSGSIGGARSYAGYHKSKNGNEYIYSIIVNNYNGSSAEMIKKMWKLLDVLK